MSCPVMASQAIGWESWDAYVTVCAIPAFQQCGGDEVLLQMEEDLLQLLIVLVL